jgi:ubiquinone/menaquinone biosynthesis C-methylase UbiE
MNSAASVYTHGHHESVLRSHRWRTAANSAAYLLPVLQSHMRILDIGCGPGTITADLAEHVADGHVTGLDAEPTVLEHARENATAREIANIDFETADAYALPYPDDSFCVVHAHQVLQYLDDPVHALREMRRVCKPGGTVAVRDVDFGGMVWHPHVPALEEWRELYGRVARANGGEPNAGRRLHTWARRAGLSNVTPSSSTWCYTTPQERLWWSDLWAERTVASAFATAAIRGGHAGEDDLRRVAGGWREWGAQDDGWFSVLHGEALCRADAV